MLILGPGICSKLTFISPIDADFTEVETPILQSKPSGALAKPFKSHHEALDIDVYEDNMKFTKKLILNVIQKVFGTTVVKIAQNEIDFAKDWKVVTFRELILEDTGIDVDSFSDSAELLAATRMKNIIIEHENLENLGLGNLIDQLYKKVSRPKIVNPTFLISHPIDLSPLARANDANPKID